MDVRTLELPPLHHSESLSEILMTRTDGLGEGDSEGEGDSNVGISPPMSRISGKLPVVNAQTASSKDTPGGLAKGVGGDGSVKSNDMVVQVTVETWDGSVSQVTSLVD